MEKSTGKRRYSNTASRFPIKIRGNFSVYGRFTPIFLTGTPGRARLRAHPRTLATLADARQLKLKNQEHYEKEKRTNFT